MIIQYIKKLFSKTTVTNTLSTHQQFIKDKQPFVIRGGAKKLKAYNKWTDQYLSKIYGNQMVEVESSMDGKYNPDSPVATTSKIEDMTVQSFIQKYKKNSVGRKQYYLAAPSMPTKLQKDIKRPDLLKLINSTRLRKKRKPLDTQIFLGTNNNVSPMHTDSYHNFYHLIDGEKEVWLIKSQYTKIIKKYAKFNQLRIPDIADIDYKKFPDMKNIPIIKVHLKKGDLLYIPYECWHQMRGSKGRNLGVALWF